MRIFLLHNCQSPVMKEGRIIQDLNQEEKAKMKISDYYQLFE